MIPQKIQQELALESEAKRLILDANILDELKNLGVYIWAINACLAFEDTLPKLILSIDTTTTNAKLDLSPVEKLLNYVLKPMDMSVVIQPISIEGHCCYGNCKGCLNGDSECQPVWIGRTF